MNHRAEERIAPEPGKAVDGLQMAPDEMLDLARKAAELLVERIHSLPGKKAWDGEFRQGLTEALMEDPPEQGRPGDEVIDRAAREILPFTLRLDHPRSFDFISSAPTWPGVLADFIAAGYNINACTWLVASGPSQVELVVIEMVPPLDGLSPGRGRTVHEWWLGRQSGCIRRGAGSRRPSATRHRVHEQSKPHGVLPRGNHRRHPARVRTGDSQRPVLPPRYGGAQAHGGGRPRRRFHTGSDLRQCRRRQHRSDRPPEEMADYCETEGIWLHVDAAYGGFAVLCDEGKELLGGIERADSIGLMRTSGCSSPMRPAAFW